MAQMVKVFPDCNKLNKKTNPYYIFHKLSTVQYTLRGAWYTTFLLKYNNNIWDESWDLEENMAAYNPRMEGGGGDNAAGLAGNMID